MLHVSTAPTAARKLAKSAGFLRQRLTQISKSEQTGTPGAAHERRELAAKFHADQRKAERAIADTEKLAAAFDSAAQTASSGQSGPAPDPLTAATARAARLGASPSRLRDLGGRMAQAAHRGREAAEKAQDRLDGADDDLASVALLAQITERLPDCDFSLSHPSVAPLRKRYLARTKSARQRSRL
ncbi:hypothetical protein [Tateyamaria sp.]|uniref:hypothetical protein n=1 Tax=Tateyamaria sp. TaxID=1929288 RepID=UPI00329C927D